MSIDRRRLLTLTGLAVAGGATRPVAAVRGLGHIALVAADSYDLKQQRRRERLELLEARIRRKALAEWRAVSV